MSNWLSPAAPSLLFHIAASLFFLFCGAGASALSLRSLRRVCSQSSLPPRSLCTVRALLLRSSVCSCAFCRIHPRRVSAVFFPSSQQPPAVVLSSSHSSQFLFSNIVVIPFRLHMSNCLSPRRVGLFSSSHLLFPTGGFHWFEPVVTGCCQETPV